MKRFTALFLLGGLVLAGPAFADETSAPSAFQKYVVSPVQWIHRGSWGLVTLILKVGKAPLDKGFELVGSVLGSTPNEPLWQ